MAGDRPTGDAHDSEFIDVLGSLHALLLTTTDVDEFLTEVAGLAADALEPSGSCGITARYDDHPVTVATSDARAARLDEMQYDGLSGPCLEAMTTGTVVEVRDQATDVRWPTYRTKAIGMGVRCSLSLPLLVRSHSMGALNLYGFVHADAFRPDDHRRAETFAAQASTALTLAGRHSSLTDRTRQMEQALSSRSVIDQALGILMVQERCDATTAFAMLRAHSQNNNVKLRAVAAQVITRATGHELAPSAPFEPVDAAGGQPPQIDE